MPQQPSLEQMPRKIPHLLILQRAPPGMVPNMSRSQKDHHHRRHSRPAGENYRPPGGIRRHLSPVRRPGCQRHPDGGPTCRRKGHHLLHDESPVQPFPPSKGQNSKDPGGDVEGRLQRHDEGLSLRT
jgi:hypothetical protein